MSCNENDDYIINDEIIEIKPIKKNSINQDPHNIIPCIIIKNIAPVECDLCSCIVVNRALYNHTNSGKGKLVKHFKDIAQLEYDALKLTQTFITP